MTGQNKGFGETRCDIKYWHPRVRWSGGLDDSIPTATGHPRLR